VELWLCIYRFGGAGTDDGQQSYWEPRDSTSTSRYRTGQSGRGQLPSGSSVYWGPGQLPRAL